MPTDTSSLKKNPGDVISYSAVDSAVASSSSSIQGVSRADDSLYQRVKRCLNSEVDSQNVTPPLLGYLFMAGYIDAISFSAIFVWCGFQTGNFAQVSLAIARSIESLYTHPSPHLLNTLAELPKQDRASLCSLLAFVFGLLTFGRIGDRRGECAYVHLLENPESGEGRWKALLMGNTLYFVGIACLSMSLGVQGIMARRLGTQFSTTIVLTAVFVELFADPSLFRPTPVRSRDQKWLAVLALFLGVVVGRLVLGQLGTAHTIGVGVLVRLVIAGSWLAVPSTHVQLP
ncbi:hypothetical protein NMY22_g7826 [Coprinellus aureogranulatus]|nr:hypothetical protein NMY22_g7826 [Coprinellus aureogranulatus]